MVTIIGGGIAGSALAGGLARHGIPVTLHEQQSTGSAGGAFLFVDGRGHAALRHLGLDDEQVAAASYPLDGLDYADSRGVRSAMPSRGHRFWLRRELIALLEKFADESGADVRRGEPVTGLDRDGDGHILRAEGRDIAADGPIIAADGIDSVVRTRLEPDRVPVYAGDVVLYGMTTAAVPDLPTTPAVLHFDAEIAADGTGAATFGHLWRPGDETAWWFVRIARPPLPGAADDLGLRPVGDWADAVLAATPTRRALAESFLARTEVVHVSNARNVPLDGARPPSDPILLIGDADHAITPAAGVGARDALEDADAVFAALLTGDSPAAAMAERRTRILADRAATRRGAPRRT
ncbi:NAD(P)/FAD-dependent oxidoreductase [Nocardia sp. BMG111209]|uniref:FAD-dependent oxidoreductase n=1 Tax=Nocardia sp. BMG111209 TaxID=1160137 RepID=UPI0012DBEDBA|nr:NAD(P)/FAD-dependent oxidoreductase [Nocardia sp. BMG111209]